MTILTRDEAMAKPFIRFPRNNVISYWMDFSTCRCIPTDRYFYIVGEAPYGCLELVAERYGIKENYGNGSIYVDRRDVEQAQWKLQPTPSTAPWFMRYAAKRPPDFLVGDARDPYMKRWYIIPRNNFFNIYLHQFLKSDSDEALHDHPSWNISILLQNEYTEWTIAAGGVHYAVIRKAGQFKFRFASTAHRVELHNGPCWTIWISGPKSRTWGFHCAKGWKPWQDYVKLRGNNSEIGKGCGD